jgi:hypothetical protein
VKNRNSNEAGARTFVGLAPAQQDRGPYRPRIRPGPLGAFKKILQHELIVSRLGGNLILVPHSKAGDLIVRLAPSFYLFGTHDCNLTRALANPWLAQ